MQRVNEQETIPVIDIHRDFAIGLVNNHDRLYDHPHRITQGIFVFCLSGECTFLFNLAEYKVKANDFIMIPPGSILQFCDRSETYQSYVILFSSSLLNSVDLTRGSFFFSAVVADHPVLSLQEKDVVLLKDYCSLLKRIFERIHPEMEPEIVRHLLVSLFYGVSSLCRRQYKIKEATQFSRLEEINRRLSALILEHHRTDRTVKFYADKLCLSPRYLSAIVKKFNGKKVSQMIERAVILDAQLQLKSSNLTVQQIAENLNFPNPSFFGKFFKRHTGLTPRQYRES